MLYQACRFETPSGNGKPRKTFTQRKPDGAGRWQYRLNGVARVPYRLPELLAADPSAPVLIVDGRIRIEVTHNQHEVIAATIDALATDPSIYKRTGALVHVIRERGDIEEDGIHRSAGTPRIREVSAGFRRPVRSSASPS